VKALVRIDILLQTVALWGRNAKRRTVMHESIKYIAYLLCIYKISGTFVISL
jgi:hypothetical protein